MPKKNRSSGRFFFYSHTPSDDKTDTATAWFGALCFFLSTIEYMIPKPLPFLRLGLANLPVMLSINVLPLQSYFVLILIKILGQGLIGGTLFSYIFLFSAAGTAASALVMLALKKAFPRPVSYIGISVAGAFASNAAQLVLARYYIFGESAWYIAPPFLAVGAVSGTLLGLFANAFAAKSRWYADVAAGNIRFAEIRKPGIVADPAKKSIFFNQPLFRFGTGTAMLLALLFAPSLGVQITLAAFALILVLLDGSRIRLLPVIGMSASIILFNLFAPFGKVLWSPLYLPVTEGALLLGIKKALTVEGMIFISRWMLKPGFSLPGKAGLLVSQAFDILGHLSLGRKKLDRKNVIAGIDDIMYGRD